MSDDEFPKIIGFDTNPADAYWIQCVYCEESELVFGTNATTTALDWAREHLLEHPDCLAARRQSSAT